MNQSHVVLDVTGMHCHSCSALIDETLADLPGVSTSSTSREANATTVDFDSEAVTVTEIVAAIAELGYAASPR